VQPFFSISVFSERYFFLYFLRYASSIFFSKLHVSSKSSIFLCVLSISTRSGRRDVTNMSGGIVPPFSQRPGKSAKNLYVLWIEF
jgi:hypothetical protein